MDKTQKLENMETLLAEANAALKQGDEDRCYDKLLDLIDEANKLSSNLELDYS